MLRSSTNCRERCDCLDFVAIDSRTSRRHRGEGEETSGRGQGIEGEKRGQEKRKMIRLKR